MVLYSYGLFLLILFYLFEYLGYVLIEVFIDFFCFVVSSFYLVLYRRSIFWVYGCESEKNVWNFMWKSKSLFLRLSDENVEILSFSFEFFFIFFKDGCCLFKLNDERLCWMMEIKYWK